jgi:hypothetical protein
MVNQPALFIMNEENMLWLMPVSNRTSILDTRVVLLEKPQLFQRLDPTVARELNVYQSASALLECSYVHRTFLQDPCTIPVGHNMYPFYSEFLAQLPEGVFFKAFQLIEVPALGMSVKQIVRDYIRFEKKIPFEVRLWV